MIEKMLSIIRQEYHVRSLDAGVFHKIVVRGMNFEINSYEAVGLGRVASMCAAGLMGLVKRDIFVVSPMEKEAPVITYERVKAFGKDTIILGRYSMKKEPVYVKKTGRKKQVAEFDKEAEEYIKTYMNEVKQANAANVKERKEWTEQLVTQLLEDYQLISDIFMATYGLKITEKLYHEVLFGSRDNK